MKIIVTGACGFIGSVFCLRARERGHEVLGVDNMSEGLNSRRLRLDKAMQLDTFDCTKGLPAHYDGAEVVAHFAPTDVAPILESAKRLNAGWMLCPLTGPYPQFLGVHKAEGSNPLVVPLRLYNVIGAYKGLTERRLNRMTVVPTMVQRYQSFLYDHKPFTINGGDYQTRDGSPARDFIHVLDVVDHLLELVEGKIETYVMPDGMVHLGTGRTTTVRELIDMFQQWEGRLETKLGPRLDHDIDVIRCPREAVLELTRWRMLTPAWVAVRDEIRALLTE